MAASFEMQGGKDARQQVTGSHFHIEGARQNACRCTLKHIPCKMQITNCLKGSVSPAWLIPSAKKFECKCTIRLQLQPPRMVKHRCEDILVHISDMQQGSTFEPTILSPVLEVEGRLLAAGNSSRHVWSHLQSSPQQPVCALLFKITIVILRA